MAPAVIPLAAAIGSTGSAAALGATSLGALAAAAGSGALSSGLPMLFSPDQEPILQPPPAPDFQSGQAIAMLEQQGLPSLRPVTGRGTGDLAADLARRFSLV